MSAHLESHDPVEQWSRCWTCHQALSAAFAKLADLDLSPYGTGRLVEVLREEALKAAAQGPA